MGSDSDLAVMHEASLMMDELDIPYEITIVSAHRTPDRLVEYAKAAHSRGLKVIAYRQVSSDTVLDKAALMEEIGHVEYLKNM